MASLTCVAATPVVGKAVAIRSANKAAKAPRFVSNGSIAKTTAMQVRASVVVAGRGLSTLGIGIVGSAGRLGPSAC